MRRTSELNDGKHEVALRPQVYVPPQEQRVRAPVGLGKVDEEERTQQLLSDKLPPCFAWTWR